MNSQQIKTTEGSLLIILFIIFIVWFIIRAWQPTTAVSEEQVPVVNVESLGSDSLNELADIADSGNSYGIPVKKPAVDQVGKSPLF